MANRSSAVMARLTGGPKIEFISVKLMRILGASRFVMSTTEIVSLPGATNDRLPSASKTTFSSLPTIIRSARAEDGHAVSVIVRARSRRASVAARRSWDVIGGSSLSARSGDYRGARFRGRADGGTDGSSLPDHPLAVHRGLAAAGADSYTFGTTHSKT